MNFVINIEDAGGKEYFLTKSGKVIPLADPSMEISVKLITPFRSKLTTHFTPN